MTILQGFINEHWTGKLSAIAEQQNETRHPHTHIPTIYPKAKRNGLHNTGTSLRPPAVPALNLIHALLITLLQPPGRTPAPPAVTRPICFAAHHTAQGCASSDHNVQSHNKQPKSPAYARLCFVCFPEQMKSLPVQEQLLWGLVGRLYRAGYVFFLTNWKIYFGQPPRTYFKTSIFSLRSRCSDFEIG